MFNGVRINFGPYQVPKKMEGYLTTILTKFKQIFYCFKICVKKKYHRIKIWYKNFGNIKLWKNI